MSIGFSVQDPADAYGSTLPIASRRGRLRLGSVVGNLVDDRRAALKVGRSVVYTAEAECTGCELHMGRRYMQRDDTGIPEGMCIGVSACLLGYKVRYDGGHRRKAFIADTLSRQAHLVPVCPEVECGLPVPRETLHLAGDPRRPRLVGTATGRDRTHRMTTWVARRLQQLEKENLDAFIFKKKSPSCGLMPVKVFSAAGQVAGRGQGVFAERFMAHFPRLPATEEDGLNDPRQRENFITRIVVLKDWYKTLSGGRTRERLADFHGRTVLPLRSLSPQLVREMGKLLLPGENRCCSALYRAYEAQLMAALRFRPTRCASLCGNVAVNDHPGKVGPP